MSFTCLGLPLDTGTREDECPTSWTSHAQVVAGAAVGEPAVGYPSVVKVDGRLGSPIDDWYLWCSPHDNSTAPYLLTAPEPAGPWTVRNSGNPVSMTIPTGYNDISPVHVLWHPTDAVFWAWTTCRDSSPARQETFFWKSSDGINWTVQNGDAAVISVGAAGEADAYEAAYLHVIPYDDHFLGVYHAVNAQSPDDVNHAGLAYGSSSGLVWSKINSDATDPINRHAAWANDAGDTDEGGGSGRPVALALNAGVFVFHGYRPDPALTTAEQRVRRLQGTGGVSDHFDNGLGLGGVGTFDEEKRVASDFVYHDGAFWCFYTAATDMNDNSTESVGVCSCTFPQSGFDTTWGKG